MEQIRHSIETRGIELHVGTLRPLYFLELLLKGTWVVFERRTVKMKSSVVWDIIDIYISLNVYHRFGETCHLHLQTRRISQTHLATCFTLVSCVAYSSTLKMKAISSSRISVDFHRTTRRCIPEGRTRLSIPENRTLQKHRCENLPVWRRFRITPLYPCES
jgi:hypothetical protein